MKNTLVPYWTNVDMQEPHIAFVSNWEPFPTDDIEIINQKRKENPGTPILILIRDTRIRKENVLKRAEPIIQWMKDKDIKGSVMIIPDVCEVHDLDEESI